MTARKLFSRDLKRRKAISRALLFLPLAAMLLLAFKSAEPAKDDWLPISPEDLALKDNPKSPGAPAMILYRESTVDAMDASAEEYLRIKIFTKEGTSEGDVEIPFFKGFDTIKDVRARTIRPDGTIVNFEGKPFESVIEKVTGLKHLAKTFTLPDVEPGCIIEYKFRDQNDPEHTFDIGWTVQGDLYTRLGRFSVKPNSNALAPPLEFRSYQLPGNLKPEKGPGGFYSMEVHDLPGIQEEPFMAPLGTVRARVLFFYGNGIRANETPPQFWARTTAAWTETVEQFVNKKGALESDLSGIISNSDSPETKLRKIYARVGKIRNLSVEEDKSAKEEHHENLKTNSNVEDVLKHGYATESQINYLFLGLVRAAGFEAADVFLASRSQTFFQPKLMESNQLNRNAVWVRSGTQEYYLNPGSRYFPFGILPWFDTFTSGIRVYKKKMDSINTPFPPSTDSSLVRSADLSIDPDGTLSGQIAVDFTGQDGATRRLEYRDEDETGRKKYFENEIKEWLPAGSTLEITKLENWDDISLPVHVEGTIKDTGFATSTGRRMVVPLDFFKATQAKAFQSETRVNDIYFQYPFSEMDHVKVRVPAGYSIESTPSPMSLDRGSLKYQMSADAQGGTLEIKRRLENAVFMAPVSNYLILRLFFATVEKNDDAEVVLTKMDSSKGN